MFSKTLLAGALAAAFAVPTSAFAADDKELAEIRAQIAAMKQSYEARLQALELRLQAAQDAAAKAQNAAAGAQASADAAQQTAQATPAPAPAPAAANAFNPNISLVLGGTMSNLSQDPATYHISGFMPPVGDVGPGKRSFSLGESELTLAANVDPMFSGQLTFSLTGEDTVGVEESFIQTRELSNGLNLKIGRFLSSVGYLNSQHAHAWDFVDAPLAYQVFFGGQYKPDGFQAKWLAPTDTFIEVGAELGSGASFPGSERNKNGFGAGSLFAHAGDDIGTSGSWRAGLSYLRSGATARSYDDVNAAVAGAPVVSNAFNGRSSMWIADAIYKWAPNGNPTHENFKLQGEYFHRKEDGTLAFDTSGANLLGGFASAQSGWYLQGVYQFAPTWRTGVRYDRLSPGSEAIGLVNSGALGAVSFPILAGYAPTRSSVMIDYNPSEFTRLRLQVAQDKARAGAVDNQIFLQYIMSLGTHAAHSF